MFSVLYVERARVGVCTNVCRSSVVFFFFVGELVLFRAQQLHYLEAHSRERIHSRSEGRE